MYVRLGPPFLLMFILCSFCAVWFSCTAGVGFLGVGRFWPGGSQPPSNDQSLSCVCLVHGHVTWRRSSILS